MSYRRIIVGFDSSDEAFDALSLARLLAAPQGATATLVEVFDPGMTGARAALYEQEVEARRDHLSRIASDAPAGVEVEVEAVAGSVPRELNRLAHDRDADLIVLGSTHRGPLGRVVSGAVADRLLNGAPCPVAVAPRGYAKEDRGRSGPVVVAYTPSEESELALVEGKGIATTLGAPLRLATAMKPLQPSPGRGPYLPILREHLLRSLEDAQRGLGGGVEAETVLLEGEPAYVLAQQADEAALIVTGSRGYGPIRRVLLGGVSSALMHEAPCPVVVVPRGAGDEVGVTPEDDAVPGEASAGR